MGTRCANHVTPLYPQKLALTSLTGGGRSVGIVRSRTKATEFSLVLVEKWPYCSTASCRHTCITCASAECTVTNSWWWVEELPETCKALYKNKYGNECAVGFIEKEKKWPVERLDISSTFKVLCSRRMDWPVSHLTIRSNTHLIVFQTSILKYSNMASLVMFMWNQHSYSAKEEEICFSSLILW